MLTDRNQKSKFYTRLLKCLCSGNNITKAFVVSLKICEIVSYENE